ncbi:MAG: hypothetical protein WDN08_06730 [Rhizomicrobium sp.]
MALGDVDGGADGAQVVRAGPRRHHDEIGMGDDLGDRGGDRGRRVDDGEADAGRLQLDEGLAELQQSDLGEMRRRRFPRVPPMRQRALRVGVDQRHRADAGAVGLDREMAGQRGLPRAALLGGQYQNVQCAPSAGRAGQMC